MHTLASLIEHALLLIFIIGQRVLFHWGSMIFILHFILPLIACQKITILTHRAFVNKYIPCCCLLLAAFLMTLATMHQGRLLSRGRNWQLHVLLSPIFCQSSKKAQPRYAKCVRQVARSKRQHGSKLHILIAAIAIDWKLHNEILKESVNRQHTLFYLDLWRNFKLPCMTSIFLF